MTSAGAAPFHHTRVVRGGLKWPAVRGARLLEAITPVSCHEDEEEGDQGTENDRRQGSEFPYELELCVPTAGHLALVLVKRTPGASLDPSVDDGNTTPSSTATTPAPADPRVVYVLDALPPSRRGPQDDKTRRKTSTLGAQSPLQHVDELELLQELFAPHTRAAGGKEGSVLIEAPLLCARFDCRVVSIQFIRSAANYYQLPRTSFRRGDSRGRYSASASSGSSSLQGATTSSRVISTAAPLRCVVARDDGMAFLWEWQADLFQWVFLNKLCFLENPNLKWTRPVVAFTTSDLPLDCKLSTLSLNTRGGNGNESGPSGATEFIWWSRATKHEPKLKIRRLRFERATDALRATDVVVGNAFIPKPFCNDVVELLSSKLGLFVISRSQGVFFRSSVSSLKTVTLNWNQFFLPEESIALEMSQFVLCLHSVTGELVILHRESGGIYIVTPKSPNTSTIFSGDTHDNESCTFLFVRRITTLTPWKQSSSDTLCNDDQAFDVRDVVAHRHVFLVLTCSVLHVYALITGELLETVSLPNVLAYSSQRRGGEKCKFWTISGGASSVGLWAPCGFWTIRLPPAEAVAAALRQPQSDKQKDKREFPNASFLAVKDYGTGNSHWDAVRYGLDILARLTPSAMNPTHISPEVWETVWHAVSSPALVLALLDNWAESEHIVHELTRHVASIYAAASSIRSPEGLSDPITPRTNENPLLRLTPANVESLHHLSNWIFLAKRKLACLETAGSNLPTPPMTESSDRCASTHQYSAMTELTGVLANEDDLSIAHDRQHSIQRKDSILDPEDTRNFRLSRKLRPMSSLRFAGGCSTSLERQGRQWLLQLESFLLDGVAFKNKHRSSGTRRVIRAEMAPSHRLFHSERVLSDFCHVAASSFSKHMYLESMSRLYLLYEPGSVLPFVRCVDCFCPRLFWLTGHQSLSRSHAERALTLFPPLKFFTNKVIRAKKRGDDQGARSSLLAYADLLSYCGYHSEACRALLECHLYEESKRKFLLLLKELQDTANSSDDGEKEKVQIWLAASRAVYLLILDYCTSHCSSTELNVVLMLKPAHVEVIHVLRALRTALSCSKYQQQQSKDDGACSTRLTVGNLRLVLANLMQQRCIGMSKWH
uniref:RAVE complex protein Rav1 C-terminal domain-containing protein n=1 Tax=Peronospora matthiolae TaxID=2874970 RepID=A0AAV1TGM6_9STRA